MAEEVVNAETGGVNLETPPPSLVSSSSSASLVSSTEDEEDQQPRNDDVGGVLAGRRLSLAFLQDHPFRNILCPRVVFRDVTYQMGVNAILCRYHARENGRATIMSMHARGLDIHLEQAIFGSSYTNPHRENTNPNRENTVN